jgi:hypothetical protein
MPTEPFQLDRVTPKAAAKAEGTNDLKKEAGEHHARVLRARTA